MGGSTGSLITQRGPSGVNGYRTLGSILANSVGGAGSVRRIYGWERRNKPGVDPIGPIFNLYRGELRSRAQQLLKY
jgi:hypothetical protein